MSWQKILPLVFECCLSLDLRLCDLLYFDHGNDCKAKSNRQKAKEQKHYLEKKKKYYIECKWRVSYNNVRQIMHYLSMGHRYYLIIHSKDTVE